MKYIFISPLLLISFLINSQTMDKKIQKMHRIKYCLFYDNHTMQACPDVGETFNAEAFTDRIKNCGVDYLIFHARCNQGMAYYKSWY